MHYADDIFRGQHETNVEIAEQLLNLKLAKITSRLETIELELSLHKCVVVPFTRKRVYYSVINVPINDEKLQCKESHKYLGVTLDKTLLEIPY